MNNVLVVSNYNAGRKKALMHKKALTKFLLHKCSKFRFITVDEFDGADLSDFDTIISVGGDGTVNKVVSRIYGTNKTLAVIPSGTANLLASKLGMSSDISKNLKILDKGSIKNIDVMNINGKLSVLRAGFGYDSDIICKTPQSLKNKFGYFAYFIAGIIFALRLNLKEYEYWINEKSYSINASCLIAANAANMYKSIVSVGNDSLLDDGYFDIFILKTGNPLIFFFEFLLILLGIRHNNNRAEYFRAAKFKINNTWTVCHVDGEKSIMKDDINIELMPEKLNVYCK